MEGDTAHERGIRQPDGGAGERRGNGKPGIKALPVAWFCTLFTALALSCAVSLAAPAAVNWTAVAAGWGLAGASSAAVLLLRRRSVGPDSRRFMLYGLAGNALRMLAVVAIAAVCRFAKPAVFGPFALGLVVSFLVLMAYEVLVLHAMIVSQGPRRGSED